MKFQYYWEQRYLFLFMAFIFLTPFIQTNCCGQAFSSGIDTGSSDSLVYHSFNLNGFVNPIGYSKIMKWRDVYKEGQYKGFAYLGLRVVILLRGALIDFALVEELYGRYIICCY